MSIGDKRMRIWLALAMSAVILLSSCSQAPTVLPTATPEVIIITQVLTLVSTATPLPTATPTPPPPTPTPTFNPYSAQIYYPLENCVASRLHVGDVAMVSPGGKANGIRFGLDLNVDTIVDYAQPGTLLAIVGGPYCSHGWIVWLVRMQNGVIGYTPEGDGNEYWLLPTGQ